MSALWSLAVLNVDTAIAESPGDAWASVMIQPESADQHRELAKRLRPAGLKRMTAREWHGAMWSLTRCTVTVKDRQLAEMHTGRARIMCAQALELTDRWIVAAERGRVVLGLVPPGTWPDNGADGARDVAAAEERARLVTAAAESRAMLAGLAAVIGAPEPYGRRW
jgi:hypothetical protein